MAGSTRGSTRHLGSRVWGVCTFEYDCNPAAPPSGPGSLAGRAAAARTALRKTHIERTTHHAPRTHPPLSKRLLCPAKRVALSLPRRTHARRAKVVALAPLEVWAASPPSERRAAPQGSGARGLGLRGSARSCTQSGNVCVKLQSLSNLHFRPQRRCTRADCMRVSRQRAPCASGGSLAARFPSPIPTRRQLDPLTACDGQGSAARRSGRGGRWAAAQRERTRAASTSTTRATRPCPTPAVVPCPSSRSRGLARPRRPAVEAEGGAPAGRGGGSTRGCRAGPSRVAKAPPSGPCTSCTSCPCALSSDTTHGAVARACWGPTSDQRGPHRSRSTFFTATGPLRRPHCARTTRRAPEAEPVGAEARCWLTFVGRSEHGCSGSRDAPMGSGRLPGAAAAPRRAHFDASMRAALEPAARAASRAASRAPPAATVKAPGWS